MPKLDATRLCHYRDRFRKAASVGPVDFFSLAPPKSLIREESYMRINSARGKVYNDPVTTGKRAKKVKR